MTSRLAHWFLMVVAVAGLGTSPSCSTGSSGTSNESEPVGRRPELAESYPVGTLRAEIIGKYGPPLYSKVIAEGGKYLPDIERCLERMKAMSLPKPARYDVFPVTRRVGGASLGTIAAYIDYVFYDDADHVVWSVAMFQTA